MVVLDISTDFQLVANSGLDHCAEWVRSCSLREGIFRVAVDHGFGSDENEMEDSAGEEVVELLPDFSGEGRFCSGAEDEDAHGWGVGAQAFDRVIAAIFWRMETVTEGLALSVKCFQRGHGYAYR